MCLLFVYINPKPDPGGYSLILINVRDEIYDRPTERAMFWKERPDIIGGRDLEPGKEGGTWLAMNKNGKIAALLNILQPNNEILPDKKGRGFLVVDYVKSNKDGLSYLKKVHEEADEYNGFLLVTLDIKKGENNNPIAYFTNKSNEKPKTLAPGVHAFGNSLPTKLWGKVVNGRSEFEKIISHHSTLETREKLVDELFTLLMHDKQFPVDEQMKRQGGGKSESFLQKLSSVFVHIPEFCYGSRCHTAIIVDSTGRIDYIERSLEDYNHAKEPAQWNEIRKTFNLQ